MSKEWFECKVKYEKTMENGLVKKVNEPYLVDALNFTEAERRIIEEITPVMTENLRSATSSVHAMLNFLRHQVMTAQIVSSVLNSCSLRLMRRVERRKKHHRMCWFKLQIFATQSNA